MLKFEKVSGTILISYALIGGLVFFLEAIEIFDDVFSTSNTSRIWDSSDGSSMTPFFLGLCGVAGALLINSIKDDFHRESTDSNNEMIEKKRVKLNWRTLLQLIRFLRSEQK